MNEAKYKRDSDNPSDETFLLLSTSLNSLSSSSPLICASSPSTISFESHTETLNKQHINKSSLPMTNEQNNKISCTTNTMAMAQSKSTIVHTCCYKHHCQLSACHTNNGEIQLNTSKKLLLSVPLQRKRKKVVYNRDFIGAIGIDKRNNSNDLDLTGEHRLIISHYSCVGKFTKMYPATVTTEQNQNAKIAQENSSGEQQLISTIQNAEQNSNLTCANNIDSANSIQIKCDTQTNELIRNSPISDEGCLTNISPYSSSGEDDDLKKHEKVERSSSSDSALGLDDEILVGIADLPPRNQQRRNTLTVTDYIPLRPALLPVAEPTSLPDSPLPISHCEWPSGNQSPIVVPSKMLLEARIVEIPTAQATLNLDAKTPYSRRESNVSDVGGNEENRVRFFRTPSVVVSDYSDDVLCGITLEELEFFRQQRKYSLGATLDNCSSPISSVTDNNADTDLSDLSAASSCSNLNYCGSTISVLDDNYATFSGLETPDRKFSHCSSCSSLEDCSEENLFSNNLIEALNQQQQQRKKKVCKCNLMNKNVNQSSSDSNECK